MLITYTLLFFQSLFFIFILLLIANQLQYINNNICELTNRTIQFVHWKYCLFPNNMNFKQNDMINSYIFFSLIQYYYIDYNFDICQYEYTTKIEIRITQCSKKAIQLVHVCACICKYIYLYNDMGGYTFHVFVQYACRR